MGLDFLRRADWLDAKRARGYLRLLAALNVGVLVLLVATSHGGVDRNGFLLGTDFLSFWTTGHMLHAQASVYDTAAHVAAQRAYFAQDGAYTAFFYPPSFLPFCWPLGWLSYFPALAAWLLVTGGAYAAALRPWWREGQVGQPLAVLIASFPPVLITVTHGQTSFLLAALLGLGLALVRDRPWLGGLLLGLATVKPQFGLLVPVALLLTGQWRAIAGALLGAVLLAGGATWAFGADAWAHWFSLRATAEAAMAGGAIGYAKMQSAFAAARLLGLSAGTAYGIQAAMTLVVLAAVARASWRRRFDRPLAALVLAGAPLATPFVLDYDMVMLGFPLLWLAGEAHGGGFRAWEKLILALTFMAGNFARPVGMEFGVPIAPFILAAFFFVILRRVNEGPRADRVEAGAGSTLR